MAENVLLQTVRERYSDMTAAHRRVADFLMAHLDEAAFLNTEALANRTGVSPATVVRFSTELGYSGFPGLQQVMRQSLVTRLSPGYRVAQLKGQPISGSPEEAARLSLTLDRELVDSLVEQWDDAALGQGTCLLNEARRVMVVGFRISSPIARYCSQLLSQLRPGVHMLEGGSGELPEQVLDVGPGDVVIAITLGPLYWTQTIQMVEWMKEQGVKVIGITDSPLSPLAALSDVTYLCPHQGLQFQFSLVPATLLVNALVNATAVASPQGAMQERLATVAALSGRWGLLTTTLPQKKK